MQSFFNYLQPPDVTMPVGAAGFIQRDVVIKSWNNCVDLSVMTEALI